MKTLALFVSHLVALAVGFALGVYLLPVLVAPQAPSSGEVSAASSGALYTGEFRRDLKDSDFLHWGEGEVFVSSTRIALAGKLAPGPDYKLYLSPEFVGTEADFERLKPGTAMCGLSRISWFRCRLQHKWGAYATQYVVTREKYPGIDELIAPVG